MKSIVTGIATALLLSAPTVQAQETTTEAVPVVYFNMPFGAAITPSEPTYGLKLAQVSKSQTSGVSLFNNRRPALLDFQLQGGEMKALSINGVNTLQQRLVHHADGTTTTQSDINWKYVGWGLLGFGAVWWWCEEQDWDLCGGDHDSDPDPVEEVREDV